MRTTGLNNFNGLSEPITSHYTTHYTKFRNKKFNRNPSPRVLIICIHGYIAEMLERLALLGKAHTHISVRLQVQPIKECT